MPGVGKEMGDRTFCEDGPEHSSCVRQMFNITGKGLPWGKGAVCSRRVSCSFSCRDDLDEILMP